MQYTIYRNNEPIASARPTGQQEKEIMVKDIVPMTIESPDPIGFQIGDYVDVWGERYILNQWAEIEKTSMMKYTYSLNFQAQYYALAKWKYRFYDQNNELKLKQFELMGTLDDFLDLAVANANRNSSGWTKGDVEPSEAKLLPIDGENILVALSQIAQAFETEWWVVNKTISFIKKGSATGIKFEYGFDKGLRGGLRRTNVDSGNVFSRLKVEGSEQNLPSDYLFGQKRLQLPSPMEFIQGKKYGPDEIEADIIFDDIRPERIGTIGAVGDKFTFTDIDIDFDVNAQILPGLSPKISFVTGKLAGYNFDIAKGGFNNTTKTFTILPSDLEKASLPSDDLKPAVGDTYYIFDIKMPDSYVTEASNRLLERGLDYFSKNAPPRVSYEVIPDKFYFGRKNLTLNLGDYYGVKDHDLGVDKDIRMIGYVRDLHEEFKYPSMQLSDVVTGSPINRQYAEAEKLKKAISLNKFMDVSRSRLNWKNGQELMNKYFDPSSESIYKDAISTLVLRALMIETGDVSQQLEIPGVIFTSNFEGDANKINWTSGVLNHATIAPNPVTWNIPGGTVAGLDPAKSYYIYARCNRTTDVGEIFISEAQYKVDVDPAVYYFWIGLANSVVDTYRTIKSLYGSVRVYGRTIEGGRILGNSLDIDLDAGTIKGQVQMLDGSYTDGVVIVGEDGEGNAFISGITLPITPGESVRFGAGGEYGDTDLPFKVLDNGTLYTSKLIAEAGYISGFTVDIDGLINLSVYKNGVLISGKGNSRIIMSKKFQDSSGTEIGNKDVAFGNFSTPGFGDTQNTAGFIENGEPDKLVNTALMLSAYNASGSNVALNIQSGDIVVKSKTGLTKRIAYSFGSTSYHIEVVNGIIVENGTGA